MRRRRDRRGFIPLLLVVLGGGLTAVWVCFLAWALVRAAFAFLA